MKAFRAIFPAIAVIAVPFAAVGCPESDPPVTGVVFGVTTNLHLGTDYDTIAFEMKLNGNVSRTETIAATKATIPLELPFAELAAEDSVEVTVSALLGGTHIVDRTQRTTAIGGKTLLLKMPLDQACSVAVAPMCGADQTCAAGQCVDVSVDSSKLPAYSPLWAKKQSDDPCKLPDQAPAVEVGSGQGDYLPLDDGEVLDVEAGPQGGFHVWLALRMHGLHQSSSVTMVTGSIPSIGYDIAPYSVVFTFDPSEGGYCKIYGLRFRLDDPSHPIESLLGKDVELTIQVSDTDGTVGTGKKTIKLSDTII